MLVIAMVAPEIFGIFVSDVEKSIADCSEVVREGSLGTRHITCYQSDVDERKADSVTLTSSKELPWSLAIHVLYITLGPLSSSFTHSEPILYITMLTYVCTRASL